MELVQFKDEKLELIDEFIDIGYMAEDVMVDDIDGNEIEIKRYSPKRTIQLFISAPFVDNAILEIDEFLNEANIDLDCYLFMSQKEENIPELKKLKLVFDKDGDFGELYGTKIVSGSLKDKLTKSLFIIGKDGAIYHIDIPSNLEDNFQIERIRQETNKVYQSYTGVGCHG